MKYGAFSKCCFTMFFGHDASHMVHNLLRKCSMFSKAIIEA